MGLFTPQYPEGAAPAKEPSRREKKAAAEKADREQARSEGWIVPEPQKSGFIQGCKKFWNSETGDPGNYYR